MLRGENCWAAARIVRNRLEMISTVSLTLLKASSCAGLVYTVCEWLSSLSFEVRNIWWNRKFPFYLRCIYILARYLGLVGHIVHLVGTHYLLTVRAHSSSFCNTFWLSQQYVGIVTTACLQIVSAKSVYALWGGNHRILVVLTILFALELIASVFLGVKGVRNLRYISKNCLQADGFPGELIYLCGVPVLVQILLSILTVVKSSALKRNPGNMKTNRLIAYFNREAIVVVILASLVPSLVVADGIWSRLVAQMSAFGYLAFPIFLSMATSTTCRRIISIHQVSQNIQDEPPSGEEGEIFTSVDFE